MDDVNFLGARDFQYPSVQAQHLVGRITPCAVRLQGPVVPGAVYLLAIDTSGVLVAP
jgi:hypothetical protein